ncbi:DUF2716 domain-containing protein [Streptomyces sp. NPDC050564]|uniref:DUF2716 domain-containing protein n=1 Tax=Streptomyces sp. NPDC050564 TaxID=3365631 RepID=UPI0037BA4582
MCAGRDFGAVPTGERQDERRPDGHVQVSARGPRRTRWRTAAQLCRSPHAEPARWSLRVQSEPVTELPEVEYRDVWDRFRAEFAFRPSVNPAEWPAINEPADSVTGSLASLDEVGPPLRRAGRRLPAT